MPEKWGFESGGAARILPLCAPARPTAFLQTKNGRAAVRVGGSRKGWICSAAMPPQNDATQSRRFTPHGVNAEGGRGGVDFGVRKWAKNARIFGLRRRYAEYLFLI